MDIIPFDTNVPDQKITIELDETTYTFRARWNTYSEKWYLSMYDEVGEAIFEGLALMTGVDFFELITDTRLPEGLLTLTRVSGTGECGRYDLSENYILVYDVDG